RVCAAAGGAVAGSCVEEGVGLGSDLHFEPDDWIACRGPRIEDFQEIPKSVTARDGIAGISKAAMEADPQNDVGSWFGGLEACGRADFDRIGGAVAALQLEFFSENARSVQPNGEFFRRAVGASHRTGAASDGRGLARRGGADFRVCSPR